MYLYILCFIFIVFFAYPFNYKNIKGYDTLFIPIVILMLALFSGLASSRGDYLSYKAIFLDPFYNSSIEFGFSLLNFFVKKLGGGYHLLLFIVALFSISLKVNSFKKYTPYLGICTIVYVGCFLVPADMGSIRFGLGMGFLLYSLQYIQRPNLFRFSVVILVGCSFHSSLLLAFLLYFICRIKLRKSHYLIIFGISFLSFLFFDLANFANLTKDFLPEKWNIFIKLFSHLTEKAVFNLAIIKRIIIFAIATIYYKKLVSAFPYMEIMYKSYFLSICVFLSFAASFTLANRSSWLFSCVEPILLSYFIKLSDNNFVKSVIFFAIIAYSLSTMLSIVITQTNPPFNLYLPYKFFFE